MSKQLYKILSTDIPTSYYNSTRYETFKIKWLFWWSHIVTSISQLFLAKTIGRASHQPWYMTKLYWVHVAAGKSQTCVK